MAELVGEPDGYAEPQARPTDDVPVGADAVVLARPDDLARRLECRYYVTGAEQVRFRVVVLQPGGEGRLAAWPYRDLAAEAVMLLLVSRRRVHPDVALPADVAGAHED